METGSSRFVSQNGQPTAGIGPPTRNFHRCSYSGCGKARLNWRGERPVPGRGRPAHIDIGVAAQSAAGTETLARGGSRPPGGISTTRPSSSGRAGMDPEWEGLTALPTLHVSARARLDDEEAQPEIAGPDVAVGLEVGAPGLPTLEEAVLEACEVLVGIRQIEGGLHRVGLVRSVDQPDAHGVVRNQQRVLTFHVQVMSVVCEEPLDHSKESPAALPVDRRGLDWVPVTVPEADVCGSAVRAAIAALSVKHVNAAGPTDADLIFQVNPVG